MKTSSVASTGCTIDSRAVVQGQGLEHERRRQGHPADSSHSGLRNRYTTSRQPEARRGAAVLAMCWVASLTALDRAASRAKTITMSAARADGHGGRPAPTRAARVRDLLHRHRPFRFERVSLPPRPKAQAVPSRPGG